MLNPFCPHFAEELWRELGYQTSSFRLPWPSYDANALVKDTFELVLQVNGKVRARVEAPVDAGKDELEKLALSNERIKSYIEGQNVRKVIVVPQKLVNVVI
jgi:leucyl-tRNA synthetase